MEGSIVALERKACPACGQLRETGNLLMTQSTKHLFHEKYVTTGFGICEDCKKIAIENKAVWFCEIKSTKETVKIGRVFLLKSEALDGIEKEHKEFAKENHWMAVDEKTANEFENAITGGKNGKE